MSNGPSWCEIPGCRKVVPRTETRCTRHRLRVEERPDKHGLTSLIAEVDALSALAWNMSADQVRALAELRDVTTTLRAMLRSNYVRNAEDLERYRRAHAIIGEHFPTSWWTS